MFRVTLSAAVFAAASSSLLADVPAVATDIAPVHSLVSRVMEGVGAPELIVPPRSSPHGYAMRPSEARALSGADLVVWIGPALTPWLSDPLESLASGASHLALMEVPGTRVLPFRTGARFEPHDHDAEPGAEDGEVHNAHAQEDHEDHAHEEHGHDDHDGLHAHDETDDHHGHEDAHDDHHGGLDAHVWLDPRNGQLWLGRIAETLAELDPENAEQYRANAQAGQTELATLEQDIAETLAAVRGKPFIVFHDGYHYFEARFGIEAEGAISESSASAPGAARVAALRAVVAETDAKCVFSEPQFNPGLIAAVTEGRETRTGTLDPIGASLEPGARLYPALLREMATSMADCLSD